MTINLFHRQFIPRIIHSLLRNYGPLSVRIHDERPYDTNQRSLNMVEIFISLVRLFLMLLANFQVTMSYDFNTLTAVGQFFVPFSDIIGTNTNNLEDGANCFSLLNSIFICFI